MADDSRYRRRAAPDPAQSGFGFRVMPQPVLPPDEIVVDLFAGGGGASTALSQALQREPDIAINHDPLALALHAANHPFTRHLAEDIWHADPLRIAAGRRVGWLHASPDCTHFSQAKGGQPRSKTIRGLAWVVLKWVGRLRRMLGWGPLRAKKRKGRVVLLDQSAASPGEALTAARATRAPVADQFLVPDKRSAGRTWKRFVAILRSWGYSVDYRVLCAHHYGAGTSRKRLYLIARRDGLPVQWAAPTHGAGLQKPVSAADSIDWSIPCPSIFTRKRPLADATHRRIARGVVRYVLQAAEPFIVPATHAGGEGRAYGGDLPMPTITAAHRGELMAVQPTLAPFVTEHANASSNGVFSAADPLGTQCAAPKGGHFAAVAPVMVQAGHGEGQPGGTRRWGSGANYYGQGAALSLREPLDTITTRDRIALVTVLVQGHPYVIVDIGLRMLQRHELFRAQGFPADYIIDRTADGRRLTISESVRMVGNSVSPPPLAAQIRVNVAQQAVDFEPQRRAA